MRKWESALGYWSNNDRILNSRRVRHVLLKGGTYSYRTLLILISMIQVVLMTIMMIMMMTMMLMMKVDLCDKGSLIGVGKHYHSLGYSRKLCKY